MASVEGCRVGHPAEHLVDRDELVGRDQAVADLGREIRDHGIDEQVPGRSESDSDPGADG